MNRRSITFTLLLTGLCTVLLWSGSVGTRLGAQGNSTITPVPTVTANSQWTPITQNFDGVTMVLVPPGCFMMGSSEEQIDYAFRLVKARRPADAQRGWFNDEKPVHEVCFAQPFWIDQMEVSQGQFKRFEGKALKSSKFVGEDRPVEQISWFEAHNFCVLRGARLPTEAEWEYTARGPESLIYPWGNMFVADNVVYATKFNQQIAKVGSRPQGTSWVGALDMSGNVWEWVSSLYKSYPYKADDGREADTGTRVAVRRVVRGGSWYNHSENVRATSRYRYAPSYTSITYGFRCARAYN